jgi:hypothetical protein
LPPLTSGGHPACRPRTAAVGSVLWGEGDSDVAFYDSKIFMINSGIIFRFSAR